MTWQAAPTGKRGRQPEYSGEEGSENDPDLPDDESAVRHGPSSDDGVRREPGSRLTGLDWAVPDFSTLSSRQKTLKVNIPYRGSQGPLHLLIDSTGIKVEGEGEWTEEGKQSGGLFARRRRKHGGTKRRARHCPRTNGGHGSRRKIHIGIDAQTLEIRAAAIIPPRRNAKPWKPDTAGAIARFEALRASKRLGRTIRRRWSGYHRRSRVETKMYCMKLPGQRLIARDFDRQVAEFQARVVVLHGFTALGIPVTEAVG